MTIQFSYRGEPVEIILEKITKNEIQARVGDKEYVAEVLPVDEYTLSVMVNDRHYLVYVAGNEEGIHIAVNGEYYFFQAAEKSVARRESGVDTHHADGNITAPMPGRILKILVTEGQRIAAKEKLFIVEAMKMENEVRAPRAGIVKKINFKENDLVSVGEPVIELEFDEQKSEGK